MGKEGAGVVEKVGAGAKCKPGDRVAFSGAQVFFFFIIISKEKLVTYIIIIYDFSISSLYEYMFMYN